MTWLADTLPRFSARLPAPPKHEWLEVVKYWNQGGRDEVWFVASPLRSDLALIDGADRFQAYRWTLPHHELVGGVRPDVMNWHRLRSPGWYLGEGWSLTPETAGVAGEDGHGPSHAPIRGWIRRRSEEATLMVGGRNLEPQGQPARITIAIDGRVIDESIAPPGFFLRMLPLAAGALLGSGDYATITVRAEGASVAVEQFDVQSRDRVVFGYGEGWHEQEYNPSTGVRWRWTSQRATLRVRAGGQRLLLRLTGEPPPSRVFSRTSRVRVKAADRLLVESTVSGPFSIQTAIPSDLLDGESSIVIESDADYVPAEQAWRSRDRRRLALRVFACELRAAS
jgi:hypothetical protein